MNLEHQRWSEVVEEDRVDAVRAAHFVFSLTKMSGWVKQVSIRTPTKENSKGWPMSWTDVTWRASQHWVPQVWPLYTHRNCCSCSVHWSIQVESKGRENLGPACIVADQSPPHCCPGLVWDWVAVWRRCHHYWRSLSSLGKVEQGSCGYSCGPWHHIWCREDTGICRLSRGADIDRMMCRRRGLPTLQGLDNWIWKWTHLKACACIKTCSYLAEKTVATEAMRMMTTDVNMSDTGAGLTWQTHHTMSPMTMTQSLLCYMVTSGFTVLHNNRHWHMNMHQLCTLLMTDHP